MKSLLSSNYQNYSKSLPFTGGFFFTLVSFLKIDREVLITEIVV
ncbi:hypothetical protein NU09_0987 [Flavobacterium beibuense]|uniref:Uncharacterized protein n=1 Tax=Flavobacterium beibuense TaxID=657326 RepID=A0A444WEX7_9FLAO|nr:hypothetical protein NU09_0987 [Flavobacterium beibuense]